MSRLTGQPPLTIRQVSGGSAGVATLCLVGAAAGPLAGDELMLAIDVKPGSHARLTATGAALAQGRGGPVPGRLRTTASVATDAVLVATPPPLVACAGSLTDVSVRIDLAATASLRWRELVVLGRTNEPSGRLRIDWDVTRDGRPLLRQYVDLLGPGAEAWPGLLQCRRVLATELVVGSAAGLLGPARTVVLSPLAVAQPLAPDAVLLTVLADDAATATATLDQLRGQAGIEAM